MNVNTNPNETALVVVDMQNDFCNPEGALYAPPSEEAIDPVMDLIERASDTETSIVYTKDVHAEGQFDDSHYYDEYERWGEHVKDGTWGAEIIDELDADSHADLVVEKQTYDAFYETELDSWLQDNGIKDLVICGTLANVCVLHTASSAGLRDYRPIVVEDALGYIEEEHKHYSVDHTDWLFGEVTIRDNISF